MIADRLTADVIDRPHGFRSYVSQTVALDISKAFDLV